MNEAFHPRRTHETANVLEIAINNRQGNHPVDRARLRAAIRAVLLGEGRKQSEISLAIVDDDEMRTLNRRHLDHDYATDVLSFVLDDSSEFLAGEVIISADTAAATAVRLGGTTADELLLYAVHGALHLAGHDDRTEESAAIMRVLERRYLAPFGVEPRFEHKQEVSP